MTTHPTNFTAFWTTPLIPVNLVCCNDLTSLDVTLNHDQSIVKMSLSAVQSRLNLYRSGKKEITMFQFKLQEMGWEGLLLFQSFVPY